MKTRQWLVLTIKYYRKLDFFQEYSDLSDERIADILESIQKQNHFDGGTFKSQREEDVLALDTKRTIPIALEDIYYDPFAEGDNYQNLDGSLKQKQTLIKNLFLELSYISRGIFLPQQIQCLSKDGELVIVTFTVDKTEHLLKLEPIDDPSLLASRINPLIKNKNYQFELWNITGENFLLMLNFEEKQKLIVDKRWRFGESNSEYISQNPQNYRNSLIQKICKIAESVDLGSESSAPIQIHFTKARSYCSACREIFNSEYEISHNTLADFKDAYYEDYYNFESCHSLKNLLDEFEKLNVTWGEIGVKGYMNSIEEWDCRGEFYIYFFINLERKANTNLLIIYHRYEGY